MPRTIRYPSEVTPHVGFFDRMADAVHRFVSSAVYFVVGFLLLVLGFGAAGLSGFNEIWFWTISLALASVTFLMVAILENGARRSQLALQHKLNAHSRALLELLGADASKDVQQELRDSIGVEDRESASGLQD
jgi:low affinity Fe/Cu permease